MPGRSGRGRSMAAWTSASVAHGRQPLRLDVREERSPQSGGVLTVAVVSDAARWRIAGPNRRPSRRRRSAVWPNGCEPAVDGTRDHPARGADEINPGARPHAALGRFDTRPARTECGTSRDRERAMTSCPTRSLPAATLLLILFPETFDADPERCHAVAARMEAAYPGLQFRAVQNRFIRPENGFTLRCLEPTLIPCVGAAGRGLMQPTNRQAEPETMRDLGKACGPPFVRRRRRTSDTKSGRSLADFVSPAAR